MFGVWPKEATWAMMLLQSIMSSSSNSERQNPQKKNILNKKNKKRRKEEGKTLSEKRWRWIILTSSCDVKCSGGLTVWHLRHKLPREREDDIHKSYHAHSRTPAFLDFGDLPTCHCYDAQFQGAKICWTLGEEKRR